MKPAADHQAGRSGEDGDAKSGGLGSLKDKGRLGGGPKAGVTAAASMAVAGVTPFGGHGAGGAVAPNVVGSEPEPAPTATSPAPAGLPPVPAMMAPAHDDTFAPAMAAAAPPAAPAELEPDAGRDWCGWDRLDPEEFWYRVKVIEAAGITHGDDAYQASQRAFGFRDLGHFQDVKDAYSARYSDDQNAFSQAGINATLRLSREQMDAAKPSYGDGNGIEAMAADKVAGSAPTSAEPCSFERFVEIEQAQAAWTQQGQDIGAKLLQVFAVSLIDWADLGAYWRPRIGSDVQYAGRYTAVQGEMFARYGGVRAA